MIINHYKGAVTRWCWRNGHAYFTWQSRFYDHIIRDAKSLKRIRHYIARNPLNWDADQEHPARVHETAVQYARDAHDEDDSH